MTVNRASNDEPIQQQSPAKDTVMVCPPGNARATARVEHVPVASVVQVATGTPSR